MTTAAHCDEIGFDVLGATATLELRRPDKRNAVTTKMWDAILQHLESSADRDEIRVLVIRGAGGAFCAGADLDAVKEPDGAPSATYHALAVEGLAAIAAFPAPSVACIQGACIGGGCSIALACDLRVATPNAVFGIPAVRHRIVYDAVSIARLREIVGPSNAGRLLYTGECIDAQTAARIGLIDECTNDDEEFVVEFARQVGLGDRSSITDHRRLLRAATAVAVRAWSECP